MEKIVLVGGSVGRDQAEMYKHSKTPVWCVARIYDRVPYADLVFDMHTRDENITHRTYQAYSDNKLVVQQKDDRFPNAAILPTDELIKEFGLAFTSSFSWMTAYALHLQANHLVYYGINMAHESEQGNQRDGLMYLLGYAKAKGVRITTTPASLLNRGVNLNENRNNRIR